MPSLIGCQRLDLLIGYVDPTVRGFTLFQGYGGVVGLRSTEVVTMKQSMYEVGIYHIFCIYSDE